MNTTFFNRITLGLLLIAIGTMYLLNQLGITSFHIGTILSTYWPVFLIYYSVSGIILHRKMHGDWRGTYVWNIVICAIGVYFLARNLDVIDFSFSDLFPYILPLLLILFGLQMLFGNKKRIRKDDSNWDISQNEPINDFDKTFEERFGENPDTSTEKTQNQSNSKMWGWDANVENRNAFIGDIYLGQEKFELKPMNISHFIGDTMIDLTKAFIPIGETRVNISAFIGDVKVFVPNDPDLEIRVVSSFFVGDNRVFDHHESGMFRNMNYSSQGYDEADKKISIHVNAFIGDIRVQRVG